MVLVPDNSDSDISTQVNTVPRKISFITSAGSLKAGPNSPPARACKLAYSSRVNLRVFEFRVLICYI